MAQTKQKKPADSEVIQLSGRICGLFQRHLRDLWLWRRGESNPGPSLDPKPRLRAYAPLEVSAGRSSAAQPSDNLPKSYATRGSDTLRQPDFAILWRRLRRAATRAGA